MDGEDNFYSDLNQTIDEQYPDLYDDDKMQKALSMKTFLAGKTRDIWNDRSLPRNNGF